MATVHAVAARVERARATVRAAATRAVARQTAILLGPYAGAQLAVATIGAVRRRRRRVRRRS